MVATAFYLSMLQKCINSKQKFCNKRYPLYLRNILRDFSANNMNKTGLNGCMYNFSVDYRAFDTSNIIDIHKYLMKKHDIK